MTRLGMRLVWATLFLLSACSSSRGIFADRSRPYRKFLDSQIKEATLYNKGKKILWVKAIPVSEEMRERQLVYTPGHAIELKDGIFQVVIGIAMSAPETFMQDDFQFYLEGQHSTHVREITDLTEIELRYPFAYPYHRVFVLEFERGVLVEAPMGGENAKKLRLEVHSPVGPVTLDLIAAQASKGGPPK